MTTNALITGWGMYAPSHVMTNDDLRQQMEKATPLGRIGDADEIAAGVLFLVSPAGAFITGKVLEIDGGTEAPTLDLPLPDL